MSKRKIELALKNKNISVEHIEYVRGCPTPSGYANGWNIEISEKTEDRLYNKGFSFCELFNEFDTTEQVLDWIDGMPELLAQGVNKP